MGPQPDEVVALIPVRGGSKGIPRKNIKPLAGMPLVYWTAKACSDSERIDRVCVSTDDAEIRRVVEGLGLAKVEVVNRSAESASDTASTESVMLEFARERQFAHVALVQATSPLLTADDVDGAIDRYFQTGADSLLSVCRTRRFLWRQEGEFVVPDNYDPARRPRRQEWGGQLVENGALYVTSREALLQSGCRLSGRIAAHEMPDETYFEIDEPADWAIVEMLLSRRSRRPMEEAISRVKLVCVDVDGTLTDGGMYYSADGEQLKRFDTRDAKGLAMLREAGLDVAIVTSEDTPIVTARARKIGVGHVLLGVSDKMAEVSGLLEQLGLQWDQLAFIGDDVNDRAVMERAGFSACPSDAPLAGSGVARYTCIRPGGHGAVREVCGLLLDGRG
jgi:N-acylneuraminate cytidylyltransferase